MASIRKSLALSFAAKYSDLVISTVSVIVIARLLTPAEIGVYSVGAAVTALGHALLPFGSPVVSLLRREMAFGALYVVGVTNSAVHAITAITLTILGFSFTSLAWAALAAAAATAIAARA